MKFVKNIFFITLPSLVVVFFLVELGVRAIFEPVHILQLTGKEEVVNPMSFWADVDAFSAYSAKPQTAIDGKSVNSFGFISTPELALKKDPETIRIVFLGGSSTAGTGFNLPDSTTWPFKTYMDIEKSSSKKIEFINAALGGYTTFESYGRLWSRLRFFDPDIVIINHGWNEMYYFTDKFSENPLNWRVKRSAYGEEWGVNKPLKYEVIKPHPIDDYIHWSQILSRLRRRFADENVIGELVNKKDIQLSNNFNANGVRIFEENLRLLLQFCKENDIEAFVCKQPTLISYKNTDSDIERIAYEAHGFDHSAHLEAYDSIYSAIDKVVPSHRIIDLTELSGQSDLFYDHVHPTEFGSEKISTMVSGVIKHYLSNDDSSEY